MYIDYSKIVTNDFKLYITEEKLTELKDIAKKEKTYLKNRYSETTLKEILSTKAEEIVYINTRHQLRNNVEKAIIASNIIFDNKKFANILKKGNYDIDTLQSFLNLLNYLKSIISTDNISENDKKYFIVADNFAKKLVNLFIKYVGISNQNIIINKINEIISFEPELLEQKSTKHTR